MYFHMLKPMGQHAVGCEQERFWVAFRLVGLILALELESKSHRNNAL